MPDKRGRIAVIGGANMDIGGFPKGALVAGDSNPGMVRMSAGGVGRNIAENAARLGLEVELISALGSDANGRALLEDCREKHIGTSGCLIEKDKRTSVYLFLGDARGDMHCAINDMEIQDGLLPERLADKLDMINSMDAVVIDANLPAETIVYLGQNIRVPVFADAVSLAKCAKLRPVLGNLFCLKPNRMEAELLAGMQIRDALDAAEAARRIVAAGLKRIYITMGEHGAVCADAGHCIFLPNHTRSLVNTTGAGDAFTAALVWAYCEGMDLKESGMAGMAAADIALNAMETVSPDMNRNNLKKRIADFAALQ